MRSGKGANKKAGAKVTGLEKSVLKDTTSRPEESPSEKMLAVEEREIESVLNEEKEQMLESPHEVDGEE